MRNDKKFRYERPGAGAGPRSITRLYITEVYAEMWLPQFATLFDGQVGLRTGRQLERFQARRMAEREMAKAHRLGTPEALAKVEAATREYHRRLDLFMRFPGSPSTEPILFALEDGMFKTVCAWDGDANGQYRRLGKYEVFDVAFYVPGHGLQWFCGDFVDVVAPDIGRLPVPNDDFWPIYSAAVSALLHEQRPAQFAQLDTALSALFDRCNALAKGNAPRVNQAAARLLFVR